MRRSLILLACAPVLLLGACATTPPPAEAGPPASATADSAYGMFLAGSTALTEGHSRQAAQMLDLARVQSGDNPAVAERAFTAALMAGEIDKAAALAPDGPQASEPAKRLGRLVKVVAALAQGKAKAAEQALGDDEIGFPHRPAAVLLKPWVAAAAGDDKEAVVAPELRGDPGVAYFGQIGQAWLYERAHRYDEAETDFKAVTSGADPSSLAVIAYGGFLERRGRRADAIALYDAALKGSPTDETLKAARAQAAGRRPAPPAPTLRQGAAFALLAPAASMISAKEDAIGLAYLRLSLHLDPDRNDAWLMVGDILQARGDAEGARAAYERPKPGSPEYPAAQAKLAWNYQGEGDTQTALKLARAAAASGDFEARLTLSDLLRADEQYPEAITLLSGLIGQSPTPDWQLYYARGQAEERAGQWPQAEADLQQALKLRPDEPELLNYLGYAWIDRGQHLDEALDMVKRAVAADPRSGAITDSLGWAYYRLGDYKKAVDLLEQAVELDAGDPEINNHLGDAYWMVGRKDEAVFQWRRVLTLSPDAKLKTDAETKIASGLGPAQKVAGQ